MPWETFTADLLWARAVHRLSRRFFPDVTAAPSRTAVAAFNAADPAGGDASTAMSISDAVFALGKLLEGGVDDLSTAVDAEVFLRKACRLAVTSRIVNSDPLSEILHTYGARHVSELRAVEIHEAAAVAHRNISQAYSAAVGRDITGSSVDRTE